MPLYHKIFKRFNMEKERTLGGRCFLLSVPCCEATVAVIKTTLMFMP